jgi:hypothetical protein
MTRFEKLSAAVITAASLAVLLTGALLTNHRHYADRLRAADEAITRLQEEVLWQRAALDALGKVHVQIEFAPVDEGEEESQK